MLNPIPMRSVLGWLWTFVAFHGTLGLVGFMLRQFEIARIYRISYTVAEMLTSLGTQKDLSTVVVVIAGADEAATFIHLDATTVLARSLAAKGIYPAVDVLESTSTIAQAVNPHG